VAVAYATVEDLLRFALQGHHPLGPEMTELVTRGQADTDRPGARYGYGFTSPAWMSASMARV
jgi:hypothetical protein